MNPVVIFKLSPSTVSLIVSDPEMVQDLFTSKNAIFDKNGTVEAIFGNLLGHSFLFSKADEKWKAKRKACAHAFYKDKLVRLLETLRDKIEVYCDDWIA